MIGTDVNNVFMFITHTQIIDAKIFYAIKKGNVKTFIKIAIYFFFRKYQIIFNN